MSTLLKAAPLLFAFVAAPAFAQSPQSPQSHAGHDAAQAGGDAKTAAAHDCPMMKSMQGQRDHAAAADDAKPSTGSMAMASGEMKHCMMMGQGAPPAKPAAKPKDKAAAPDHEHQH